MAKSKDNAAASRNEPSSKSWLDRFVKELQAVAVANDVGALLGPDVRLSKTLEADTPEGWAEGVGWYVDVGHVKDVRGTLSIWLDRYLDLNGDAHLGVWFEADAKSVDALADAIRVPAEHRYRWEHRNSSGLLLERFARRERTRKDQWLLDEWTARESFLGKYVVPSPELYEPRDVVGTACGALRAIADLVADPHNERDEDAADNPHREAERYWTLIKRLARPGQARFRKKLLLAFGAKCVITGCSETEVLDAVHIKPVADLGNDDIGNGLLLRADLHRLFDAGLLTITGAREPRVVIAKRLVRSQYRELLGCKLAVPLSLDQRKSLASRFHHWSDEGLPFAAAPLEDGGGGTAALAPELSTLR
jgi:hypothetical protein